MIVDTIIGHDAEAVWRLIRVLALLLSVWEWKDAFIDLRWQVRRGSDISIDQVRAMLGDSGDSLPDHVLRHFAAHTVKLRLMLAKWRFVHDGFMVLLTSVWAVSFWWASRLLHGPAQDTLFAWQNVLVALLIAKTIYLLRIRWMIQERHP